MALFGFNSAMAAELIGSTQYTNDGYQYKIKTINKEAKTGTVSVRSTNWTVGNADVTKISIKSTITLNVKGEISTTPFEGVVTFNVVEIEEGAFKGLDQITSIEFASPCNITEIGTGAFIGTSIENLDLTPTKITTLNKLFVGTAPDPTYTTTLKTVQLPTTLETIVAEALQHSYALNSVDFTGLNKLTTIGANALGDNVITTLDLGDCVKLTGVDTNPFVGKTGESGEKNKTLTTLVLPTKDAAPAFVLGTGLANLYNLTSVNLQATTIETVTDLAFENDKSLTALTFPKTLKTITTSAADKAPFKGCAKLETLDIPYDALTTVGDGTNPLFLEATVGDGTLAALKTLNFFTATSPDPTFKATIAAAAFANCTGITTVKIAEGKEIGATASLKAGAIALSNEAASTVVFGKLSAAPEAGFIAGPITAGVQTTVTFGEVAAAQAQSTAIISGNIGTFTVGKLSAALCVEAIGAASKIVFAGEITKALTVAGTRVPNARLTEIDFGTVKIANTADIIPAAAFDEANAANLTTVSWAPADADIPTALVFNKAAFGTAAKDAAAMISFSTKAGVANLYPAGAGGAGDELDKSLYNVKFVAAAIPAVPVDIKVFGPAGSPSFIGYFACPAASNYKIAKTQLDEEENEATITVYSAFVDESDNKLYMDPMQIINGEFVVEKGQVVVIRSTKSFDVKAFTTDDENTMRYHMVGGVGTLINDLKYTAEAISADELGTMYYDAGQYVYYLSNPTTTGAISFNILGSSYYLPAKSVYTVRNGIASARMDIVWLDNSDEATAILDVMNKKALGNGAIYNLSGQKVNASYKGVVIKNGKTYIQK